MDGACKRPSSIEEWRKEIRALNKHAFCNKNMTEEEYQEVRDEIFNQELKRNKK